MAGEDSPPKIRYVPAVGPRLKKLLFVVYALFALLAVNSAYLGTITWFEWLSGKTLQDYFYQLNFLLHLALGLVIIVPVIVFGALHFRNAWPRPNRRVVLTRLGAFEIRDPAVRAAAYWLHVVTPFAAAWLFVLHRLAGKRINWKL